MTTKVADHFEFDSERAAFQRGLRDAIGPPTAVLFAGFIGFGALGESLGLSVYMTVATSVLVFALPGQIVLFEMLAMGSTAIVAALASTITAARFMPMTLTVMPQFDRRHRNGLLYLVVHFLAMTSWAVAMRDFPKIKPEFRRPYFTGFSMLCWCTTLPGSTIGYLMAGSVPTPIKMALIFLNPLFFLLNFTEVRQTSHRLAIVFGGLIGPLVYLVYPDYSLLAAGLIGGSLAYTIHRWTRARAAQQLAQQVPMEALPDKREET
jgi:predicted branched-subunit amino acid permease